jgi:DNA polymerase III subunit chi
VAEQVEFHTGVEDVLAFTCRLLRKAQRQGAQLVCTAPPATLAALDQALWTFEEREFVPMCAGRGPQRRCCSARPSG